MSNALLSDVEARAHRRRTRTQDERFAELATQAWQAAQAASGSERLRWLDRAHRLAPLDGMVALSYASALLESGDHVRAEALLETEAGRHSGREAWAGLAAARLLLNDRVGARQALANLLRRRAPTAGLRELAAALAPEGWVGVDHAGRVHARQVGAVTLDGVPVVLGWHGGSAPLPEGWRAAAVLAMAGALGSPIPLRGVAGLEGFVEASDGGIAGWAHCPADPDATPRLRIVGALGERVLEATVPAALRMADPFARPRRFSLNAAACAALGDVLAVRGPDGRHVAGSPVDPLYASRPGFVPVWVDTPVIARPAAAAPCPVSVVIPVYGGGAVTRACIASVLAAGERGVRVIVVDDASPDPELAGWLDGLARRRRITLLRLPENRGFPAAANAGMAAAAERDVVLLNSDTLVPPGWLARLRRAAYAAPDIGSATPLTNDGTIVSYPDPAGGNPAPDLVGTVALDRLAQANDPAPVDIPVGVGFCMYLRRACLDRIGLLREDVFAQGYGEENDLCLRARQQGFRHVAAPDVFVAHVGAASFGAARGWLMQRNAGVLNRLHPGYDALVKTHVAADPLRDVRAAMDTARWVAGRRVAGRQAGAVVLVTHAGGGGVERLVQTRVAEAMAAGRRAIVVRPARVPAEGAHAIGWAARVESPGERFPNLVFPMPEGLPALARLLRGDRVARVEVHHTLGHHPAILDLARRLRAPAVSVVHDYARFCPRIALVGAGGRYCGEPDVTGCEACVADHGSLLDDEPPVRALVARSAAELGTARVVVPSADVARRMRRHFPGVVPEIVPWEDDAALERPSPAARVGSLHVAVVGAIGVEKGFDVLLACVRDARARALPIRFTVVGYTMDDPRLLDAGPVAITGPYAEAEATALIRAQAAQLAWIPSVFPETWCFALTRAWEAGLPAAVFDLGAQAERVRARPPGAGWVLPPGLPARALNDALLRVAPAPPALHSPPRTG